MRASASTWASLIDPFRLATASLDAISLSQHRRQRSHGYDRHLREQFVYGRERLRSSQTELNASARFVDEAIRRDERRPSPRLQQRAGASAPCGRHQNRGMDHQR